MGSLATIRASDGCRARTGLAQSSCFPLCCKSDALRQLSSFMGVKAPSAAEPMWSAAPWHRVRPTDMGQCLFHRCVRNWELETPDSRNKPVLEEGEVRRGLYAGHVYHATIPALPCRSILPGHTCTELETTWSMSQAICSITHRTPTIGIPMV